MGPRHSDNAKSVPFQSWTVSEALILNQSPHLKAARGPGAHGGDMFNLVHNFTVISILLLKQ